MNTESFRSELAPYMIALIENKLSQGRVYLHGKAMLLQFDAYCAETCFQEKTVTKELVESWGAYIQNYKPRSRSQRMTYVRQLAEYMESIGIQAYVPPKMNYSGTADPITLSSPFAPYIQGLIAQKRADGYIYKTDGRALHLFDRFCCEKGIITSDLDRDIVMEWLEQTTLSNTTCLRQLAQYMISLGKNAYIPKSGRRKGNYIPHILSTEELTSFFEEVDRFIPTYRTKEYMVLGFSVMFRLFYCCGMRLQEVCQLRVSEINLQTGCINIIASKGRKDRIVYLSDDLRRMCHNFDKAIRQKIPVREWFFPASDPAKSIHKSNMTRRLHYFWDKTPYAGKTTREPNIHALRHTFVVNKMNEWMRGGIDFQQMMPYLSQYLGHATMTETYYYYHLAVSAFDIIREHDSSLNLIPEVTLYEE